MAPNRIGAREREKGMNAFGRKHWQSVVNYPHCNGCCCPRFDHYHQGHHGAQCSDVVSLFVGGTTMSSPSPPEVKKSDGRASSSQFSEGAEYKVSAALRMHVKFFQAILFVRDCSVRPFCVCVCVRVISRNLVNESPSYRSISNSCLLLPRIFQVKTLNSKVWRLFTEWQCSFLVSYSVALFLPFSLLNVSQWHRSYYKVLIHGVGGDMGCCCCWRELPAVCFPVLLLPLGCLCAFHLDLSLPTATAAAAATWLSPESQLQLLPW